MSQLKGFSFFINLMNFNDFDLQGNGSQSIVLTMKSNALEALAAFWHIELRNGSQGIDLIMKRDASGALGALSSEMLPRASI